MINIVDDFRPRFEECIAHLKKEIAGMRSGRANTALIEDIQVEAYGSRQAIKSLAGIMVQDAKTILIQPWDKSVVHLIEKAITEANIGINPVVDGVVIRLPFPQLTEETRKEIVKALHQKLEQSRISVRNVREEAKNVILDAEEKGKITEDERYGYEAKLDASVKDYNIKIKTIGDEKEVDVMKL